MVLIKCELLFIWLNLSESLSCSFCCHSLQFWLYERTITRLKQQQRQSDSHTYGLIPKEKNQHKNSRSFVLGISRSHLMPSPLPISSLPRKRSLCLTPPKHLRKYTESTWNGIAMYVHNTHTHIHLFVDTYRRI